MAPFKRQAPIVEVPVGFYEGPRLFAPAKTHADGQDGTWLRACYLHACLKYVNRDYLTNTSLRERFGIEPDNKAMASRYIREAVDDGKIKPYDVSAAKKLMKYVPFWA